MNELTADQLPRIDGEVDNTTQDPRFRAPLVLTFGWIETRQASAVSAVFNLLNSAAALAGVWATMPSLPKALPWWLVAVGAGGLIGSWFGVHYLPAAALRYILAVLLLAAGIRMVLA